MDYEKLKYWSELDTAATRIKQQRGSTSTDPIENALLHWKEAADGFYGTWRSGKTSEEGDALSEGAHEYERKAADAWSGRTKVNDALETASLISKCVGYYQRSHGG